MNVAKINRSSGRSSRKPYDKARLKRVTAGPEARRLDLAKQYDLRGKGDVARRLGRHKPGNLNKSINYLGNYHGHRGYGRKGPHYGYYGVISPLYGQHHFRSPYRWPSYYAVFHIGTGPYSYWCPRWSPWVRWSWYYHCGPTWDPRPIWCRPWGYVSCTRWIWWDVPVWEPLPTVVCGTWVDTPVVEVPAAQLDLQLLAVRFVDAGHPDEKLGPRYRVWFRNNSTVAIDRPFDVMLFAENGPQITKHAPLAGVRVNSIQAGETQSVDIRLPFEVQQMGLDDQGQPCPFSTLHVLVDANREIDETSEINNGTQLAADLILPVDPSVFEAKPQVAEAGSELLLAGEGLGPEPGRVIIQLGGIEMDAEIVGWFDLGVRLKLADLPLAAPVEAELIVVRQDGVAANPITITLGPKGMVKQPVPEEIVLPQPELQ